MHFSDLSLPSGAGPLLPFWGKSCLTSSHLGGEKTNSSECSPPLRDAPSGLASCPTVQRGRVGRRRRCTLALGGEGGENWGQRK